MDTPPPLEEPWYDESIGERIYGLTEMFPASVRNATSTTISKSVSCVKKVFSASRVVAWFICSTAAILVLPISLEKERVDYEEQVKRQERNIILGPETGGNI